jgi:hypothetical protein
VATHLTNKDLTIDADLIVVGECVDTAGIWMDRKLYTLATILVSDVMKGDASPVVTVALPGGVDVNRKIPVAMTYPGAPHVAPREEVLLFLTHGDDEVAGTYAVMGVSQGKFSIVQDDQGRSLVSRGPAGLEFRDAKVVGGIDPAVPLAVFKHEIRSYLQSQP